MPPENLAGPRSMRPPIKLSCHPSNAGIGRASNERQQINSRPLTPWALALDVEATRGCYSPAGRTTRRHRRGAIENQALCRAGSRVRSTVAGYAAGRGQIGGSGVAAGPRCSRAPCRQACIQGVPAAPQARDGSYICSTSRVAGTADAAPATVVLQGQLTSR
jgi:hypothetical protein